MNNYAIICEYNPFHSGHKYQLEKVKEHGADNVVCVMSGQFVQSGLPAFCDKALRAECAVAGGADAVIELPTVFATASAQIFAEGALKIISEIKDIKYLAMGATSDSDTIKRLADIKITHSDEFKTLLKRNMKSGKSYNASSVFALCELFSKLYPNETADIELVLSDPNNVLCIEYICAINKLTGNIEPLIIPRKGALHGTLDINAEHISATAIRHAVDSGDAKTAERYMPFAQKSLEFVAKHKPDIELYKNIAVFALKCKTAQELATLRDCSEGMEYLLKNLSHLHDFDAYINETVGKRYGKKRMYRTFLDCALGIEKRVCDYEFCTRLLACKNVFDFSLLPHRVKTNNASIKAAAQENTQVASVLGIDERAVALYNTLCAIDGDYYNYSLVKV